MSITLDPSSRRAVIHINTLGRLTKSGVEHGAYTSGRGLVSQTSKNILAKPKHGRTYIRRDRSGRKRKHVASKAGESIANRTGKTRRSLSFRVNPRQLEFGYGVDKNDAPDYAEWPEFGSKKIQPRGTLMIGIKGQRRNMMNNFETKLSNIEKDIRCFIIILKK